MNDRVIIATIVTTHGRKGEVKARVETDFPDRFSSFSEVVVVKPGQEEEEVLGISSFRWHKGHILLKFDGYETIEGAIRLVGSTVELDKELLPPLPEGYISYSDIIGYDCLERGGRFLGKVTDIYRIDDRDMIEVEIEGRPVAIPVIPAFFSEVDTEKRRLELVLPDGLLDL